VSENRVLRRIFGSKRSEVTGEWRKLHNEELNGLYSSPNIVWIIKSRRMRLAGHVAHMGRGEAYTGLWWGKRTLGRHGRRQEDNIKMDLQKVECRDMDWIKLSQDRDRWRAFVTAVINFRVP
jgi:hypothetical protein